MEEEKSQNLEGVVSQDCSVKTIDTSTKVNPSPDSESGGQLDGAWGERNPGVNQSTAMEDYEQLRRELTRLSRTSSNTPQGDDTLLHTLTGRSATSTRSRGGRSLASRVTTRKTDLEQGRDDGEEDFDLGEFIRDGYFEKRTEAGESTKKVGVLFKNLTVKGLGSKATFVKTLPDAIIGTFGPDLYRILSGFFSSLRFGRQGQTRDLIHDFTGVVRHGEMMLVLGKPGSGCSTFLKAIANNRESFAGVTGEVSYGGITAEKQNKYYRGEVSYNPEDDAHMPALNVWQTLKFSLLNKTRKRAKGEIDIIINALLKMFAIRHTSKTLVGNEYVRGVSGGERKRVSIAETLATKSTVTCWDNSTRGLDASTALDYAKSLRIMTDVSGRTTLVTLYQVGQSIYDLMDKVLVIESGRMIYQGPAGQAKQYFIDLGFHCPDRQTTADFLVSVTDPLEREFREGFADRAPKTAEELERVFKASDAYRAVLADVEDYEKHLRQTEFAEAKEFKQSVKEQKSKNVPKSSSYTVSFWQQILACTRREFWLFWGDKTTIYTKLFVITSMGLIVGSLFYNQPDNTEGAFSRGGTAFFSILFLGWLQLTELMKAVSGRVVIARHKEYAFYRPSAVVIARVITDLPLLIFQVVEFGIIMYFMTNLNRDPGKFFIYLLFIYTTTLCLTALYRMFAALSPSINDAVRFSGLALNLLVIYTGYVIPKTQLLSQKIWFGWIYYINPIAYSFEGVLANEFSGRVMQCAPQELVPQGLGVQSQYQGCAIDGAQLGSTSVSGEQYLATEFSYYRSHLWRNFGVVVAFTVLYILVTAIASELFAFVGSGGGALIFKRSKKAKSQVTAATPDADGEKGGKSEDSSATNGIHDKEQGEQDALEEISGSDRIFTWTDVEYSVPYEGGQRKLLNKVSGYAKPGIMVALMGASGAGKTTLLNSLAQRQRFGILTGDMLVDGRPLDPGFQRGTGFCEQMDLHDDTATVREALEFSAILRQEPYIPRQEKIAYVDKIIDLLELGDLQDAIIMSLGVEQRKRLTIGVELAAKPSLLLFLDEPTSGLDSQSAYSIVRFLRKLAAAGQAIICTIHQPSSILIQQFDMILALNPGGNTFYFGPVGENGGAVIKYFGDRGVHCPPSQNVAEFIIETAIKGGQRSDGKRLDWNQEWRDSVENKELLDEIGHINLSRSKIAPHPTNTQREFASPIYLQTTELTKRVFTQYWRDPSYLYSKIFTSVIIGIFNAFTFYKLGNTVQDMQNRMFTSFLIIVLPPTVVNGVVPKFFQNRSLWEFREQPSRIYGWVAFCTAQILAEIPIAILSGVIYWLLWYWPVGFPSDSSTAGYVFLMTILFFLFMASWGQWITAFAPSFTVISNTLPFFFVVFSLFNGVVRPYSQLSPFWRYWMYYLNPSTYWIGGILAATLPGVAVQCAASEAAYFNPPPGQTCSQYAADFVRSVEAGYLTNPSATSNCGYCPYTNGTQYMKNLNVVPDDKWRNLGIFAVFVVSNYALVYFFTYTTRIRGWSFGLGTVFGWLGKGVGAATDAVAKVVRREKKEGE
ncbi:MAG: hypothetical protein MMC33_002525 [Icmadophila ericetorum]|nr:hypothetical protein [Icmadophila ericetorum]